MKQLIQIYGILFTSATVIVFSIMRESKITDGFIFLIAFALLGFFVLVGVFGSDGPTTGPTTEEKENA